MSSATETTASPGSQKGGFWAPISPVIIQLTAATAGITATFPLFVAKTAKQLGQPNPMMSVMQAFRAGAATAPNMGAIIATQLIAKRGVEKLFSKQEEGKASFSSMFLSAAIVGAISAPPLAIFNGQLSLCARNQFPNMRLDATSSWRQRSQVDRTACGICHGSDQWCCKPSSRYCLNSLAKKDEN